jgi:hypothetical protein
MNRSLFGRQRADQSDVPVSLRRGCILMAALEQASCRNANTHKARDGDST